MVGRLSCHDHGPGGSGAQRGSAALFGAALRHRLNAAEIPASPGDPQLSRRARMPSFSDDIVAITAEGSYPQWAMQFAQRGSLPRPYFSHSVVSISSLYDETYPSDIR